MHDLLRAINILNDALDKLNQEYHMKGCPDPEKHFIRCEAVLKFIQILQDEFDAEEKSFCEEHKIEWLKLEKNQLN
jgi:hypothetical protein